MSPANFLTLPILVSLIAASLGALTDVWHFRVYNSLTIPLGLAGILYHTATGGTAGLAVSLSGLLVGFGLLIIPYALGMMGGGDVKLLAAIGAWLGIQWIYLVFTVSVLLVGAYAVVLLICTRRIRESWTTIQLIYLKFLTLGFHLVKDDLVEDAYHSSDRRARLIPFAAAFPFGIVGAMCWHYFFQR